MAGNDAQDGRTEASAWKSLDRVNATSFSAGDKILFKAGCEWEGRLRPKGSGSEGRPIVINQYGTGKKPYIKGNMEKGAAVYLYNQQYWEINNLEVTNTSANKGDRQGICFENQDAGLLQHIYVKNCDIHDVTGVEITTGLGSSKCNGGIIGKITTKNPSAGIDAVPSVWDDILIDGNTVKSLGREGIYFYSYWSIRWGLVEPDAGEYHPSTRVVISNNHVEDIDGDGVVVSCCDGAIVERNYLRLCNARPNGRYHAGMWMWSADNCIFRFNEVCETKTTLDGMAFDFDNCTTGNVYEYNYSHDNEGGFILACSDKKCSNNIVRYNLSFNDGCIAGSQIIMVYGTNTQDIRFYNNTFIYSGTHTDTKFVNQAHGAGDSASNIDFKNNIICKLYGIETLETLGCAYLANSYYGVRVLASDTKAVSGDPLFTVGSGGTGRRPPENFKLMGSSPCIEKGEFIPDNGGKDYFENSIYKDLPDIGFYEFQ